MAPRNGVPAGSGFGLVGMRERAELLGGELEVRSGDGGFRVRLWVPSRPRLIDPS